MEITYRISYATPAEIAFVNAIMKLLTDALNSKLKVELQQAQKQVVRQQQKPVAQKSKPKKRVWSKKALKMANTKTPEAPYGYRMDGTPRKPTGIQKKEKQ